MNGTIVLDSFKSLPHRFLGVQGPHAQPVLHAMLANVGHEWRRAQPYSWDGLKRGRAEFGLVQVTLDGEGYLNFEGREYALRRGQAMILTVPHAHRYALPEGKRWHFFYVTVYGNEVTRHWRHAVHILGPVLDLPFESTFIQAAARLCLRLLHGERLTAPQASAEAYGLTMRLLDLTQPASGAAGTTRPADIRRAIEFCRSRLGTNIGVADLAAAAGCSRYHFSRRFTRSEGCAPGAYLVRERIRLAVRLLQTTDTPVKALAAECGFHDAGYFCRVFRKSVGVTPGALRRSGMAG
ncbi:MAG: AraC family transcriptional regulator [Kiritimatiellae bacterium]|nr:AraC family transcriptional regulator [Kiritimatiellia bacterium]